MRDESTEAVLRQLVPSWEALDAAALALHRVQFPVPAARLGDDPDRRDLVIRTNTTAIVAVVEALDLGSLVATALAEGARQERARRAEAERVAFEGTTVWSRFKHEKAAECPCCEGRHVYAEGVHDDAGRPIDMATEVYRQLRDAPEGSRVRVALTVIDAPPIEGS